VAAGAPIRISGDAQKDPRFRKVIDELQKGAARARQHVPASHRAAEAQAASISPANEKLAAAKAGQVEVVKGAEAKKPDPNSFLTLLRAEIEKVMPKNLDQSDKFMKGGEKEQIKSSVQQNVADQKDAAAGPTQQAAQAAPDTSQVEGKPVTPMPPRRRPPPRRSMARPRCRPRSRTGRSRSWARVRRKPTSR